MKFVLKRKFQYFNEIVRICDPLFFLTTVFFFRYVVERSISNIFIEKPAGDFRVMWFKKAVNKWQSAVKIFEFFWSEIVYENVIFRQFGLNGKCREIWWILKTIDDEPVNSLIQYEEETVEYANPRGKKTGQCWAWT